MALFEQGEYAPGRDLRRWATRLGGRFAGKLVNYERTSRRNRGHGRAADLCIPPGKIVTGCLADDSILNRY